MIKIFLARYFGLIILVASKDVSLSNRLHYFLEALGKTAIALYLIDQINNWFLENHRFALFLCVALLANIIVGTVFHLKNGTWNFPDFFKKNGIMIFAVCTMYMLLEQLRYTIGDNIAGEIVKATIQAMCLMYPTSKVAKNFFILTNGQFPPPFLMDKIEIFVKTGDLREFFDTLKKDKENDQKQEQ